MNLISIREERHGDAGAIRDLHAVAFEGPVEARIVDRLRAAFPDLVSFVAVDGDAAVETGRLTVTLRRLSPPNRPHEEQFAEEELIRVVGEATAGMPFRPPCTARRLSVRPRFIRPPLSSTDP